MVNSLYNSNLVKTLEKAEMGFLIPACPTSYDDDEVVGHLDPELYEGDEFDADFPIYDVEEFEDNEYEEADYEDYSDGHIHNIDELMLLFDCDDMEPSEFVKLDACTLFGLTLPQFKLIKPHFLNLANISYFLTTLKEHSDGLSVEQRIKWATCCAVTECDRWAEHDVVEHCKHISNLYEEGKAIETIRLYTDYLSCLPNALIMNNRRKEANQNGGNEPVFDYEKYPKPSHIKDLHDKAFRDYNALASEMATEEKKKIDNDIKDVIKNPMYKRFLFSDGQFEIIAPKFSDDIAHEGRVLNHCIETYTKKFADFETFLYFLRKKEKPDDPYFSIEVEPNFTNKTFKLEQCYTYNDSIEKSQECRDFIRKWCNTFGIRIACEI